MRTTLKKGIFSVSLKILWLLTAFYFTRAYTPLYALEIRLFPPEKIYVDNDVLLVDISTSDNLLSESSVKNFKYNIPFTITYYLELHEKKWWFGKKIKDIQIIKHVRQDFWSRHYFVSENGQTKHFTNYADLQKELIQMRKISVIDTSAISPNKKYYFKTRIAIKIRNFASFYYLINNLVSLFEYRTTYINSNEYLGSALLKNISAESAFAE